MNLIIDPSKIRLGANKGIPGKLARTLKLAHYLLPAALMEYVPPEFDWFIGVPDAMDLNDQLGDCVVAAMAKMVRSWTANASATNTAVIVTSQDILTVYERGAGYNPKDPSTDQGWDLLSALAYWKATGIAGHKIGAYVAVNPRHHMMVRAAQFLFGGLYIALELPVSAQSQAIWDVDNTPDGVPGSWGGHCVTTQAVLQDQVICRTWGSAQPMTWAFLDTYCVEAYAVLSPEYFTGGKTCEGLDITRLTADMALVAA